MAIFEAGVTFSEPPFFGIHSLKRIYIYICIYISMAVPHPPVEYQVLFFSWQQLFSSGPMDQDVKGLPVCQLDPSKVGDFP